MKENSWNYFRIRIKHEGKKNTAGLCPADVYYNCDGKIYSINNEGSDIYFGNPPFMIKITNADNNIIIEYIKSILRIKEQIINEIENKIDYLKKSLII